MGDWYVLRTISSKEETAAAFYRKIFPDYDIIYPKRRICWRKCGNLINIIRPLFEGYLFVSTDNNKIHDFDNLLHKLRFNVGWLVYTAGALMPIFDEEKKMIQMLMGTEGIVEVSEIEKVQNRFSVVTGPLMGFEAMIKKFSAKNRRITVEIPILTENKRIELGGIWKNANNINRHIKPHLDSSLSNNE
ncbi:transcription termination/antitermination NusG family protein [Methylomusa anaerophila]|uniref:Transcription antitermination protein RfaH n=1 Tax=Methylomusa anaerophila TaxID=1930071 RepID=A0A348AN84_9FIRM|nr:transcription termination/antitermination NusG family protein [Methylomusa anaerophila]BBB92532.1 transcription antitermination protein RfaH [Methylomusa anaerophila]